LSFLKIPSLPTPGSTEELRALPRTPDDNAGSQRPNGRFRTRIMATGAQQSRRGRTTDRAPDRMAIRFVRAVRRLYKLRAIFHLFTEGFDTAELKDAKALLEESRNSPEPPSNTSPSSTPSLIQGSARRWPVPFPAKLNRSERNFATANGRRLRG
jgi:hypothetical protein